MIGEWFSSLAGRILIQNVRTATGGRIVGLVPRAVGGVTLPPSVAFAAFTGTTLPTRAVLTEVIAGVPRHSRQKKNSVLKLRGGRVLAHPIHFTVRQSFDAMRCDVAK